MGPFLDSGRGCSRRSEPGPMLVSSPFLALTWLELEHASQASRICQGFLESGMGKVPVALLGLALGTCQAGHGSHL